MNTRARCELLCEGPPFIRTLGAWEFMQSWLLGVLVLTEEALNPVVLQQVSQLTGPACSDSLGPYLGGINGFLNSLSSTLDLTEGSSKVPFYFSVGDSSCHNK